MTHFVVKPSQAKRRISALANAMVSVPIDQSIESAYQNKDPINPLYEIGENNIQFVSANT